MDIEDISALNEELAPTVSWHYTTSMVSHMATDLG